MTDFVFADKCLRVISRLLYQLLCQRALTFFHRSEGSSRQQMATQLHLSDHFYLRIKPGVPCISLARESDIILWPGASAHTNWGA
ncbi:Uncharacterised protein [Yersinia aleksiciae]|nr:Uncharacterised protein [Yersinia aleksiciae]